MLAFVGLFSLITLVSGLFFGPMPPEEQARKVQDCPKVRNPLRQDFFTSVRFVSPYMRWDCELERSAQLSLKTSQKPSNDVTELRLRSSIFTPKVTPRLYVQTYPWRIHRYQIGESKTFGCYLEMRPAISGIADYLYNIVVCHFKH